MECMRLAKLYEKSSVSGLDTDSTLNGHDLLVACSLYMLVHNVDMGGLLHVVFSLSQAPLLACGTKSG